ncbi:DUF4842 domain-containing protein [Prevotella sp. E13-27]|uniref:DUF4842 domain-containing protein n=1 Tax=Prevotella sp. E13-27 TaxID=2938122 RepID=UPI00200AABEC|nr:DUF4842 domain-containing protein [Prevotella sp. E13-27]MCK8621598.1 DUF4842 domain-containing protein [Prevotella sp. E13-27]
MKQNKRLWYFSGIMAVGCLLALNSCEHDMDKYQKKPVPSDAERVSYAEKVLGITIDKQQDWVLTKEYSVKIIADADLQDIFEVRVLNAHPYAETNAILASSAATNGNEVTLRFRSPFVADSMLYAACVTKDGKCIARPFIPGVDASVSFIDKAPNQASARRYKAATVINPPQSTMSYIKDYYSFIRALKKALPEGNDNRTVIGGSDYTNIIQVRKNPYDTNSLLLAYLGGNSGPDDDLFYVWYPGGTTENKDSFHIIDNYPAGWITPKMSFEMQAYEVPSHYLNGRDSYGNLCTYFSQGDILDLHLMKNGNLLDDTSSRVKVYMFNGYVFVGCEDGDNWDYNDRMFWMPYGADRVEKAEGLPVPPEPSEPKVWTYVWEDKDYGDYDLNDCVIEVQENKNDRTKLDITLVALGGARQLWLGFDNKNAKTYKDYTPVWNKELHSLLDVATGTLVNTGRASANPVKITLPKPEGFDFQTCSFVLGAKHSDEDKNMMDYDNDFYYIKIATVGQDPHGIVIPEKWQWPTETTCIKDAYPKFNTWSADHTKAQDWYKYPVSGKVVKRDKK